MTQHLKACVIGWPIKHSRSPIIHGYWLRHHGIDGDYGKIAVPPEDVPAFIRGLRPAGYRGCNVTVPHKEAVIGLVDRLEEPAEAVGAANTVWIEADGRLAATNTDIYGFGTHLVRSAPQWRPERGPALVLGAGGAARAVVYALLAMGVPEVRLANRTRDRAEELRLAFGPRVAVIAWEAREPALADTTLLVNTTTLGMAGAEPLVIDLAGLPGGAVVADIVYVPLETALLSNARRRGLVAVDGLGMLLHQAVPGFEKWFGVRPEVTDVLRSLVVADIGSA
jgi:shikimate dehydrogenase